MRRRWGARLRKPVIDPSVQTQQFLKSCVCMQRQLESETFRAWILRMGEELRVHRKQWEWAYIAQALHERGLLQPGSRGLAFATGREPLPSLFASYGCEIVASDWSEEAALEAGWVTTNQHASDLEVLNERGLCPPDTFRQRVSFRVVDMNDISGDLRDFDFLRSACSLEHLGSIAHGEQFIYNAMNCLKPGGLAVHTTEFNLSSNSFTADHTASVLFRRRDLERIARNLLAAGHRIELDFTEGEEPNDLIVDPPPFTGSSHLKLLLGRYVSTSIGLIIQKVLAEPRLSVQKQISSPAFSREG